MSFTIKDGSEVKDIRLNDEYNISSLILPNFMWRASKPCVDKLYYTLALWVGDNSIFRYILHHHVKLVN